MCILTQPNLGPTVQHWTFVGKYKDIRFKMDDKELVKCLILHWKWETISFFLIMVVNGLICIGADIWQNIGLFF